MRNFFIIIGFLIINMSTGQDLKKHQWENRVLLIVSQNEDSEKYRNQIAEFNTLQKELMERKMLVYCVLPQQYRIMNSETKVKANNWISSSALFDRFTNKETDFRVILIGLDGGIKLEKTEILSATELFETIDAMPMRRAELNRNKN
jgi:hypothetical protein